MAAARPLAPGTTLAGRYAIEHELGRGGMAVVYHARDLKHDRPVAVKVLHAELASALASERFLREIRTAAQLHHPHILPLHDSGAVPAGQSMESDGAGALFYVMPYVAGESLRRRLTRGGPLPVAEALRLAAEVADALEYAHAQGIVHRDVKPENILLDSGHAVVADFGIARAVSQAGDADALTGTGLAIGTPAYMSPEQATGETTLDGRADVYALGCVLYEMLVGEPPHTGPTPQAVIARRMAEPPRPLRTVRDTVPPGVEAAVLRALARAPADRFDSAAAFRDALLAQHGSAEPPSPARTAAGGRQWRRRGAITGAVLAVALLAAIGGTAYVYRRGRSEGGAAAADARDIRSVAVLPFANMSADSTNEYLSDGLTEELIAALSRVPGLRVPSRTSAFSFKGRRVGVAEIGRRLDVGAVLEGSVRRSGDRLRVTAQLIDARTDSHLWSETYEREMKDVFAVQDDISRSIVAALRLRLGGATLVRRPTQNLHAYELYLRGRQAWSRRTTAGLREALALYEQAVAADSSYVLAHVGVADAYNLLGGPFGAVPPREAYPKAREAATRALALDPNSAEAHTSLAYVHMWHDWDWPAAEREFRRALELNPSYDTLLQWYAYALMSVGRRDDALATLDRAHQLDPTSFTTKLDMVIVGVYLRDWDRVLRFASQVVALDSTQARSMSRWRGVAFEQKGMRDSALAVFAAAGQGFHLARMRGDTAAAAQLVRDAERRPGGASSVITVAGNYALVGMRNDAFRVLERTLAERQVLLTNLRAYYGFDGLRADPRYRELERKVGLWR